MNYDITPSARMRDVAYSCAIYHLAHTQVMGHHCPLPGARPPPGTGPHAAARARRCLRRHPGYPVMRATDHCTAPCRAPCSADPRAALQRAAGGCRLNHVCAARTEGDDAPWCATRRHGLFASLTPSPRQPLAPHSRCRVGRRLGASYQWRGCAALGRNVPGGGPPRCCARCNSNSHRPPHAAARRLDLMYWAGALCLSSA